MKYKKINEISITSNKQNKTLGLVKGEDGRKIWAEKTNDGDNWRELSKDDFLSFDNEYFRRVAVLIGYPNAIDNLPQSEVKKLIESKNV